ncbi:uncharacterized protein FA14DRAFT_191652 [Meira miltonrushii]|uniref:CLASP N-terminal domain-containing protein n=1 Tax=Meira miltonrushii TaxID=1280837 RepID=A0A316V4R9_9BASI|nr:uncharacterized protein FA14DRAFT_191652 [Meira miltonrushii]PWN32559.1 hypothetical protein FA14DRAFT_191652 [Meira miltonrushii]
MASSAELQFQLGQLIPALHLVETEDSWQKIDGALSKLETITKSGAYKNEAFVPLIKEHSAPIVTSLLSERTKLSGSAADLLTSVAPRLANRFEPLISTFIPPLLQLCARTNKVALVRAKKCLLLIAKHCKLASLLSYLRDAARDKSITLRNVAVEVTLMLVESIENLEKLERRVGDIEVIIKSTATDRDPEVRQWSKRMFELYGERFPYRLDEFTAPLTPTTRRYLALKNTDRQAGPSNFSVKPIPRNPVEQQRPRASPEKVIRAVSASSNKQPTHTTVKRQRDASASARSTSAQHVKQSSRSVSTSSKSTQNTPSSDKETRMQDIPPPVPVLPSIDPAEERERAILKAEVARMTSATPSRGIAARLALEQFEMKVRSRGGTDGLKAGSSSRAALTAFAVAASKKHSSPKRMPARVPLPRQPLEERKNTKVESKSTVMPQRVVRSPVDPVSRPTSPDVFGSRPIPKEATQRNKTPATATASKRTSTLTKNMGARGKLLGNATTSSSSTALKQRQKPAVKSAIPVASPRPKFFASPPSARKANREDELNQLGDIMEALTVTGEQEDADKENVPDVVMKSNDSHTKKETTPPLPERRSSSDSKRRSCELEPLQTINGTDDAKRMRIQSPSSIIQSRPILSPRSVKKIVRPAFTFGRMAPLVVSGKKI